MQSAQIILKVNSLLSLKAHSFSIILTMYRTSVFMSKYTFLLIVGLCISILPYLGFPSFWKLLLYTLGGLSVAVISVLARIDFVSTRKEVVVEKQPAYVESSPPHLRRPRQVRPRAPKVDPHVDVVVPRSDDAVV